ncbi:MAG: cell envelope integrity protein TolA [Smithella sp.]|nr:cell envelope integrity protein TolA [Smithella sp.]
MNKSILYGICVLLLSFALATPGYSEGFIVHSSEGSEMIGVDNTDDVVISPEGGRPHFKDISNDNWEITSESRNQQNIEGMIQNRKDAQHRAEQKRKEQEAERDAKEAEAKKQAELKCYTNSFVSGGHVIEGTNQVSGGSIVSYRICKDKYGRVVSKDRI